MDTRTMRMPRRSFMGTAGLAMLASLSTARAATPGLSVAEQENLRLVNDFCAAWATVRIEEPLKYLADDCVYRMTETMPPATGHAAIASSLQSLLEVADALEFAVLASFAKGPLVVNHRIDTFTSRVRPLVWEGVGVFFIRDGKIAEWFDYTISMSR